MNGTRIKEMSADCACHRTVEDMLTKPGAFECPVSCGPQLEALRLSGAVFGCEACTRDMDAGRPFTGCPHEG